MVKRSTVTSLLKCDDLITHYLNKKYSCDIYLLDFTRAFNNIASLGVCEKLNKLLANFFSGRTQFVSHGGDFSESVISGVIHSSVMGFQIFTIIVSDCNRPHQWKWYCKLMMVRPCTELPAFRTVRSTKMN